MSGMLFTLMGSGALLARLEAPTMMVVNTKGGNHKLYEYSSRAMADLKVQTRQRQLRNQCLLSTNK